MQASGASPQCVWVPQLMGEGNPTHGETLQQYLQLECQPSWMMPHTSQATTLMHASTQNAPVLLFPILGFSYFRTMRASLWLLLMSESEPLSLDSDHLATLLWSESTEVQICNVPKCTFVLKAWFLVLHC